MSTAAPALAPAEPLAEFAVEDPATGKTIARLPDADATYAVADAAAQQDWAERVPRPRADVLTAAHALMLRRADELATLISRENGKVRADAVAEVTYGAEFLRWYAEEAAPGSPRVAYVSSTETS